MTSTIPFQLLQRGRASVDFLVHMGRGSESLRADVAELVAQAAPEPEALPDDLDAINELMESRLYSSAEFRVEQLIGEWHGRQHGLICREAFEEVAGEVKPRLAALEKGPSTLQANPEMDVPSYWDGVAFHRTAGEWDGYGFQGFVHAELIHRKIVDAFFPGGIHKQRRMVAEMAPRDSYRRILDMGCSTGFFTLALADCYPDAEIHGVDLSLRCLEHTLRTANHNGFAWVLRQAAAEETGYADNFFDLVGSYIMLHEMPEDAIRAAFTEAYRVLEPGGDLIMSDVTRYADLPKIARWKADRGAMYGGEPHWRASASLDLGEVAHEAGFQDVIAQAEGPNDYPFVVRGRKPS